MVVTRARKRNTGIDTGGGAGNGGPAFQGLVNFRSLGGIRAKIGKKLYQVRHRVLYRCANPNHATKTDFALLRDLNARYFVDLRNYFEIAKDRGTDAAEDHLHTVHLDMPAEEREEGSAGKIWRYSVDVFKHSDMKGMVQVEAPLAAKLEFVFWSLLCQKHRARMALMPTLNRLGLLGMNITMLHSKFTQDNLRRALDLITYGHQKFNEDDAEEHAGVVINCTLGKDRTGLVTALVLTVLGVDRSDILDDYEVSHHGIVASPNGSRLLRGAFKDLIKQGLSEEEFLSSRRETMSRTLDHIDAEWGSVNNFLNHIGFTDLDQEALQAKFLEAI